jgi:hypothetical protein
MKSTAKFLCIVLFAFIANDSLAQSTEGDFYVFNADWSPAKSFDKCTYFMHQIKRSDSEYVCRYYTKYGPMIKQESYRDSTLTIPNGSFCWYNENGKIDSSGWVHNYKKDKRWEYFMGDSINATYYDEYDNGKYLGRKIYSKTDTLGSSEKDSTQKEAVFGNGVKDWTKFVEHNLKVPDRLAGSFKAGIYTVTVSFAINKVGKVVNPYIKQSVEWSADESVFDLLNKSPDWKPAIQKGKPVYFIEQEDIKMQLE